MSSPPPTKRFLIFLTFAVYIVHLVLNGLSAKGGPGNKLFPNSVSNVSEHFKLEMTPVGATFAIWGVIFAYQLAWIIYTITTVFRDGPACNILSGKFFSGFIVNIVLISAWLFVWSREKALGSFVIILSGQVFLCLAIARACKDLKDFNDDQKITNKTRADVWCQRILVQNGLLFYATWTTIATSINFAVVLAYVLETSTFTASIVSLSILGVLAIAWFVVENFITRKYTEYTFTAYIVLIIGLTGIVINIWKDDKRVAGLALTLTILSALFLIARLVIIGIRSRKQLRIRHFDGYKIQHNGNAVKY